MHRSLNKGKYRILKFSPEKITNKVSLLDPLQRPLPVDMNLLYEQSKSEVNKTNIRK